RTFTLPNEAVFFYFSSQLPNCLENLSVQGFMPILALRKLSNYNIFLKAEKLPGIPSSYH
ncbi:hypothetical protein, partial [Paenibacillus solanacearum]|uniref:hypothetical protein n=1 Tax=Paenibacillus solanacearum TaxID=2048548 RepID=UPI001C4015A2